MYSIKITLLIKLKFRLFLDPDRKIQNFDDKNLALVFPWINSDCIKISACSHLDGWIFSK